jgi:hypothetical protein
MNHHHEHDNGHSVNGEPANEAELDAYEEKLTNEAIVDQIKVEISLNVAKLRHFLQLKRHGYRYTIHSKGTKIHSVLISKGISRAPFRRKVRF